MNNRIKEIRKSNNLSMEKFGEKIGITKSSVSLLESGKNSPSEQTVKLICREFGVNDEWLRYGTGDMYLVPEDETATLISNLIENLDSPFYSNIKHILKVYATLDPKSQDVVDDFVKRIFESSKK